jgi:hypothetical protein
MIHAHVNCKGRKRKKLNTASFGYEICPSKHVLVIDTARPVETAARDNIITLDILLDAFVIDNEKKLKTGDIAIIYVN